MAKVVITAPDYFSPKSKSLLERVGDVEARYFEPGDLARAVADCEVLCVRVETRVDREPVPGRLSGGRPKGWRGRFSST